MRSLLLAGIWVWSAAWAQAESAATPSLSVETLQQMARSADWSEAATASIEIEAPVEALWTYVSDSANAKEWSVYFDHLSPVPGAVPDGQIGSVRRCFRNPDEKGPRWDELTFGVEPQRRRWIHSFRFVGFLPRFLTRSAQSLVEQKYDSLGPSRSRLTFGTLPVPGTPWVSRMLTRFSRGETERFFRINQQNIKASVEARSRGQTYRRVHEWEAPPSSLGERFFTDQTATE